MTAARVFTDYVCKGCGAESPVGIGYWGSPPDVAAPAPGCEHPHVLPVCGGCGAYPPAIKCPVCRRMTAYRDAPSALDGGGYWYVCADYAHGHLMTGACKCGAA